MNFKKLFSLFAITLSAFGLFGVSKASAMERPVVKAVLVGDLGVGKTAIKRRLDNDTFYTYGSTVGVDFFNIDVNYDVNNVFNPFRIQLWDTAGQERFRSIIPVYIRNTDIILAVFDYSDGTSYDKLKNWFEFINDNVDIDKVKIIVVSNKADLIQEGKSRLISEDEIRLKFDKYEFIYLPEVSAKNGVGIEDLRNILIREGSTVACSKKAARINAQNIGSNKDTDKKSCC